VRPALPAWRPVLDMDRNRFIQQIDAHGVTPFLWAKHAKTAWPGPGAPDRLGLLDTMEIHVTSTWHCIKEAADRFQNQGTGGIVSTNASLQALQDCLFRGMYTYTKAWSRRSPWRSTGR